MTDPATPPGARSSPATSRNREPILQVLRARLAEAATVLEIASGAGEHAMFFARAMPQIRWRPSDPDPEARASIAAWGGAAGLANLEPPVALDAADPVSWPTEPVDAIVCCNMIHIAPWAAAEGLVALAARLLPTGGQLILYGPYLEADVATAVSNLAFDESLRSRNPAWGLRPLADVVALADGHGLRLAERIAMPANNLVLVFSRRDPAAR
jgi:SAM-dependent methyltransferase